MRGVFRAVCSPQRVGFSSVWKKFFHGVENSSKYFPYRGKRGRLHGVNFWDFCLRGVEARRGWVGKRAFLGSFGENLEREYYDCDES